MAGKGFIWGGVGIIAIAGTWLAAVYVNGNTTEEELLGFIASPSAGAVITSNQYNKGWASSDGTMDIVFPDIYLDENDPLRINVNYSISHLPFFNGISRSDFQLSLTGFGIEDNLDQPLLVDGTASLGLGGTLDTSFISQEIGYDRDGMTISISPVTGNFSCSQEDCNIGKNFNYDISFPLFSLQETGTGEFVTVQNLSLEGFLEDPALQTGDFLLTIEDIALKIDGESVKTKELNLESIGIIEDGKASSLIELEIANIESEGNQLQNLAFYYNLSDYDAVSTVEIVEIYQNTNGFALVTNEQAQQLNTAMANLLRFGFSTGIDKVSGSLTLKDQGDAHWEGQFKTNLSSTTNELISLGSQLTSEGALELSGLSLTSNLGLLFGAFVPQLQTTPDEGKTKLSYSLKDGRLIVNAFPMPITEVLNEIDMEINQFIKNGLTAAEWQEVGAELE